MKTKYFFVDINKIEKCDFVDCGKVDMSELFLMSTLPEEYRKFVLCCNKGLTVKFYDTVQLGQPHNVKFFEFISNHPFNFENYGIGKNLNAAFCSSTFGNYLKITNVVGGGLNEVNEQTVINFYSALQDSGLFEEYVKFIYTIFTNAYDKSYPPISKKLALYREK